MTKTRLTIILDGRDGGEYTKIATDLSGEAVNRETAHLIIRAMLEAIDKGKFALSEPNLDE